jgi:putative endonuclease
MIIPKVSGNTGEDLALNYLQNNGLRLICRNFYSRFGEIDLIMQDHDTTVFIEVKKRGAGVDKALESISYTKQHKLIRAARYYLTKIGYETNCRFDAIAIDRNDQILWLKNIIML